MSTINKLSVGIRRFHTVASRLRKYVELTSVRYPLLKRGNFSFLSDRHLGFFQSILSAHQVLTDELNDLSGYNVDWMRSVRGSSRLVLRPKTTEEVAAILQYCNVQNIAICPQGGNTGLVGGSVPVFDEVVLSLELMDEVISVDELSGVAIVQAGCVLEKLETVLHLSNLALPLDLGAKGSCQIGGNVATNAGGIRLLRYGNLHGSVLGLTTVLANGQIMDCLNTNKKDNTGYDLKQLFIGSEGTLGIVTQVALQCQPKPSSVQVGFFGLNSFENVLETMRLSKTNLGEILSSCELIDQSSLECVTTQLELRSPINNFPFYMLLETAGSNASHDAEKLNSLLEILINNGTIVDGTLAVDSAQAKNLWELRERISEALACEGYVYKYDVSVPVRQFYQLVDDMRIRLGNLPIRCCGYGHLGDGNLHLNITSHEYNPILLNRIEPFVYDWVCQERGSVSAEHGLGLKKRDYMEYSKSPTAIHWMRRVKKLFDPNNILNPYKIFPEQSSTD
ncbi:D-2-hydroxyglutarate dehydrogenase, mitochondrial-like [Daphnia carinata]|uniref:D-2-hydroxyglutarate dehydrogenase, mitochondrial-like n=1 Tax=Daphnia carinata TaxID=120202 RepID=UPI00257AD0F7|nr:D-2-hydroxyglutarate dehydrogenase, mitochondrial-like [Daphnia carinata]